MPANVEIKARATDPSSLAARAARVADEGPQLLEQEDVFYQGASGRLKLRVFADGHGELIHYERPDVGGPKQSSYLVCPTDDAALLRETLGRAFPIRGIVRKQRRLYLAGQTRIHLDRVEGLGEFVELEVVLRPGQSADDGAAVARELMTVLDIRDEDLVEGAYVDLLADGSRLIPRRSGPGSDRD